MERTLPSQDVFSYALIVLHIHKIFLEDSEHILVPHITLVDLLTLCYPNKLGFFQPLKDSNLNYSISSSVLPVTPSRYIFEERRVSLLALLFV